MYRIDEQRECMRRENRRLAKRIDVYRIDA